NHRGSSGPARPGAGRHRRKPECGPRASHRPPRQPARPAGGTGMSGEALSSPSYEEPGEGLLAHAPAPASVEDWDGPGGTPEGAEALYLELDGWEGPLDLLLD